MSEHAKYSPSQLPRIIRCPGSVKMTERMKQDSSSFAEEGTMLHEVTEKCLQKKLYKVPDELTIIGLSVTLDQEQRDAVDECLDYAFTLLARYETDTLTLIEHKVTLAGFAEPLKCNGLLEVWGTADLVIYVPASRTIHVIDWKYGKGIEVFPDSEQIKAYAAGALNSKSTMRMYDKIVAAIVQPRLYAGEHVKEQDYTPEELIEWLSSELVPSLDKATADTPILCPSKKACQWCLAKIKCRARYNENTKAAEEVFKAHANMPSEVSVEELTKVLNLASDIDKYISDIKLYVAAQLKKGNDVPGYKLVAGRSIRKWADLDADGRSQAFIKYAEDIHGLIEFDISTMKMLSPAQAEKKFGKAVTKLEDFQELIVKPEGKPTLAKESDKRKPLEFGSASSVFKQFAEDK